ncbi:hypothetical protein D3C78_802680 [compost metagenome]
MKEITLLLLRRSKKELHWTVVNERLLFYTCSQSHIKQAYPKRDRLAHFTDRNFISLHRCPSQGSRQSAR